MGAGGAPVEIACDESGSEGGRLIGAETSVFAYASVDLDVSAAAECVQEVRARIGSPALEYKANHLLRQKSRPVLIWLLAPSGPIHGRANVHLTDKALFLVTKLAELLVEGTEPAMAGLVPTPPAKALAAELYREAGSASGTWHAFLAAGNELLRTGDTEVLGTLDASGRLAAVIELLRKPELRLAVRATRPALDPLVTALTWTVAYWSAGGRPVSIVHDEQRALTADRIAQVNRILGPRLTGVRFVDSRTDPRVQVADFVAGVAGRVARSVLRGEPDEELVALLAPYVDAHSIWRESWNGGPM
jgi:hypothetical protein